MKLSILYDSVTGVTKTAADRIAEGMQRVDGVEVKAFSIDDYDADFVKESDGIVFGTPTYLAGPSAKMYTFLEREAGKLNLAGKLGGAFATGKHIHGGENFAAERMLIHVLVLGMMVYSGGSAYGQPVVHVGPVAIDGKEELTAEVLVLYGERFATQAKKIFA